MDNATPEEPISTFRNTTTEYNKHSSTELPATDAHRGVAKDMEGRSIGGMPIHLFLDSFLPDHKKTPLGEVDIDFFKTIPESGHETKRYLPFVCDRYPHLNWSMILISVFDASRLSS